MVSFCDTHISRLMASYKMSGDIYTHFIHSRSEQQVVYLSAALFLYNVYCVFMSPTSCFIFVSSSHPLNLLMPLLQVFSAFSPPCSLSLSLALFVSLALSLSLYISVSLSLSSSRFHVLAFRSIFFPAQN